MASDECLVASERRRNSLRFAKYFPCTKLHMMMHGERICKSFATNPLRRSRLPRAAPLLFCSRFCFHVVIPNPSRARYTRREVAQSGHRGKFSEGRSLSSCANFASGCRTPRALCEECAPRSRDLASACRCFCFTLSSRTRSVLRWGGISLRVTISPRTQQPFLSSRVSEAAPGEGRREVVLRAEGSAFATSSPDSLSFANALLKKFLHAMKSLAF